jgi:hypothetical protein
MSEVTFTFCDRCNPGEATLNMGKTTLGAYLEFSGQEKFLGPENRIVTAEEMLKALGENFKVDLERGVFCGTSKQALRAGWKALDEGHVCVLCLAEDSIHEKLDKEQAAEYHVGGTNPLVEKMNAAITTGITKDEPPEDLSAVGTIVKKPRRKRIRGNPVPEGGNNENRS